MIIRILTFLTISSLLLLFSCGENKKDDLPKDNIEQHEMHEHNGHDHENMMDSEQSDELSHADEDIIASNIDETPTLQGTRNKPIKATIVNIQDIIIGGSGNLTADKAERLLEQGQLIGVRINNEIYIVFDAGGTVPVQLLKKYAGRNVGLIGKSKSIGDLKIFIADDIIPL